MQNVVQRTVCLRYEYIGNGTLHVDDTAWELPHKGHTCAVIIHAMPEKRVAMRTIVPSVRTPEAEERSLRSPFGRDVSRAV